MRAPRGDVHLRLALRGPMNTRPTAVAILFVTFAVAACTSYAMDPVRVEKESPRKSPSAQTREQIEYVAPCTAVACGELPATSTSERPACSPAPDGCGWTDPDPNQTVSYRLCEPRECGPAPASDICPAGTISGGSQCGAENDGPCQWRTPCVAPPSTTPCGDPVGCGPMLALGVLCDDGSTGELACRQVGDACQWQPQCPAPPSDCCAAKPEIGVVCADGSIGDLICRSELGRCSWEPTCD
jgi:hypothetical protein